jgi:hypothetical protein
VDERIKVARLLTLGFAGRSPFFHSTGVGTEEPCMHVEFKAFAGSKTQYGGLSHQNGLTQIASITGNYTLIANFLEASGLTLRQVRDLVQLPARVAKH